jgi:hypothetical protein
VVARGSDEAGISTRSKRTVAFELRRGAKRVVERLVERLVPRLTLGFLREMEVAMTAGFSFSFLTNDVSSPVVYVIHLIMRLH